MTRRHSTHTTIGRPLAAATLLALGACGGGGGGSDTGQLSIAVTDAPIDMGITAVSVRFTGIELKPENGSSILFDFGVDNERDIDLLQLQGEGRRVPRVGIQRRGSLADALQLRWNVRREIRRWRQIPLQDALRDRSSRQPLPRRLPRR